MPEITPDVTVQEYLTAVENLALTKNKLEFPVGGTRYIACVANAIVKNSSCIDILLLEDITVLKKILRGIMTEYFNRKKVTLFISNDLDPDYKKFFKNFLIAKGADCTVKTLSLKTISEDEKISLWGICGDKRRAMVGTRAKTEKYHIVSACMNIRRIFFKNSLEKFFERIYTAAS